MCEGTSGSVESMDTQVDISTEESGDVNVALESEDVCADTNVDIDDSMGFVEEIEIDDTDIGNEFESIEASGEAKVMEDIIEEPAIEDAEVESDVENFKTSEGAETMDEIIEEPIIEDGGLSCADVSAEMSEETESTSDIIEEPVVGDAGAIGSECENTEVSEKADTVENLNDEPVICEEGEEGKNIDNLKMSADKVFVVSDDFDANNDAYETQISTHDYPILDKALPRSDTNLAEEDFDNNKSIKTNDVIDKESIVRNLLDQNVTAQKLPSDERFDWSDPDGKGNSNCILKDDAILRIHDKSTNDDVEYSGKEFKNYMLDKYGMDKVEYTNREPDFLPFEKPVDKMDFESFLKDKYDEIRTINEGCEGHITVDRMGIKREGKDGTFYHANEAIAGQLGPNISRKDVADYMASRNLTWHECGDRKTIRMVPSEINQAFGHSGGIGLQQDIEVLSDSIYKGEEPKRIELKTKSFSKTRDLSSAIEGMIQNNKEMKKQRYKK